MAKPITNRVKMGQTPVIKKDLEGGTLGEANNDGTIFVDNSVKEGTPLYKEVVVHEETHLGQMNLLPGQPKTSKPDLEYDDNSVTWKGKKYLRKNGKIIDPKTGKGHPEGSMKFAWEKEAHKAGKQARKEGNKNNNDDMKNKSSGIKMSDAALVANNMQTNKSFNDIAKAMPQQPWDMKYKSDKNTNNNGGKDTENEEEGTDNSNTDNSPATMKAIPITYKSTAPLKNTVAAKEFMKAYGGPFNPDEPVIKITKRKGFKDGVAGTETATDITTMSQRGADGKIRRIGGRKGSYRLQDLVGGARDGVAYTERTGEQMADAGIIHKANADRWNKNYYKPTATKPGKTFTSKRFDPEYMYEPGEPGKEGRYQPGYFEAASIAAAQKGMQKRGIKNQKSLQKDAKMFDKYTNKGKTMYDTRTGQPYSMDEAGKAEYLKYRASLFAKPYTQLGVISESTTGKQGKTKQKGKGSPGTEGYVDLDGGSQKNKKSSNTYGPLRDGYKFPKTTPAEKLTESVGNIFKNSDNSSADSDRSKTGKTFSKPPAISPRKFGGFDIPKVRPMIGKQKPIEVFNDNMEIDQGRLEETGETFDVSKITSKNNSKANYNKTTKLSDGDKITKDKEIKGLVGKSAFGMNSNKNNAPFKMGGFGSKK